eukprot:GHVH01003479.1.p1 GENE.GHVH01003479.1~~GHVH01003479.1.p1  ORF type:complete len:294 (+),score=35.26 GHVH01003479.1:30-884(+)
MFSPNEELVHQCLISKRGKCAECDRMRFLFCDKCLQPVNGSPLDTLVHSNGCGSVNLGKSIPKLLILQHPGENSQKSTAGGLKVMSPECIEIKTWRGTHGPESEEVDGSQFRMSREKRVTSRGSRCDEVANEDLNPVNTVLLYPTNEAKRVTEIADWSSIERVVVIDSTWFQSSTMMRTDERLKRLPSITIKERATSFWRHQNKCEAGLSTAEAVYHLISEIYEAKDIAPPHNFDDLMLPFEVIRRKVDSPVNKKLSSQRKRELIKEGNQCSKQKAKRSRTLGA